MSVVLNKLVARVLKREDVTDIFYITIILIISEKPMHCKKVNISFVVNLSAFEND